MIAFSRTTCAPPADRPLRALCYSLHYRGLIDNSLCADSHGSIHRGFAINCRLLCTLNTLSIAPAPLRHSLSRGCMIPLAIPIIFVRPIFFKNIAGNGLEMKTSRSQIFRHKPKKKIKKYIYIYCYKLG